MIVTPQVLDLIDAGALFFVNHSGGKDSQAMYIMLSRIVPADQIIVIHAHLPEVEWEGVMDHIQDTITQRLHVCQSHKTFFDLVRHRGYWPSPQYRNCTSDLKTGPLNKLVRRIMRERGAKLAVNCVGLRAEESTNRNEATPWKTHKTLSKAGRTVFEWLPIHKMLVEDVFATIRNAGQEPHFAYSLGMSRLSCVFCIMGRKEDHAIAAKHNPEVYQRIAALEQEIDQTFVMPKKGIRTFLPELVESFKPKPKQLNLFG